MRGRSCVSLLVIAFATVPLWPQGQNEISSQPAKFGNSTQPSSQLAGIRRVPDPPVRGLSLHGPVLHGPARPDARAFRRMVHAAGIIFSGTVTKIEAHTTSGAQSPQAVAITFHVDHAIRGAIRGGSLTISQWTGLWASGQRYRIGERVALFLYPTSRLGLTSSVSGAMGRFEVSAAYHILISEQHRLAFRDDAVLSGRSQVTFQELAQAVRDAAETKPSPRGAHEN